MPSPKNDHAKPCPLADYQQQFFAATAGDTAAAAIAKQLFKVLPKASHNRSKRLGIYQHNQRAALLRALQNTFQRSYRILGSGVFNDYALRYIQHHPSRDESLSRYGKHFPDLLSHQPEIGPPTLIAQYSAELAHFEYLQQQCYYAANQHAARLADFLAQDEELQLASQWLKPASVQLMTSHFDLLSNSSDKDPSRHKKLRYLIVFRVEGKVRGQLITQPMFSLLLRCSKPTAINQFTQQQLQLLPSIFKNNWLNLYPL